MPTLGFLKKKRTKDSSDPKDLASPTSPIKESPSTPTFSSGPTATSAPSGSSRASTAESRNSSSKHNEGPAPATGSHTQALPIQTVSSAARDVALDQVTSQVQEKDISITKIDLTKDRIDRTTPSQMDGATGTTREAQLAAKAAQPSPPALTTATLSATPRVTKGKYLLADFAIQRTLGTGSFGRVHLVQSKHNQRFYAIKVLKKQQVVKMKQVEHTNDERRMLQKVKHPFLITLWGTFQDSKNLYMVMDFVEGGELFSLLRKSQVSWAISPFNLTTQSLSSDFPTL